MKSIYSEEYIALLGLLVEARRDAGLTQEQLAKHFDKHQSFIAKIENGERRLDVIEFLKICKVIKADYNAILSHLGSNND